MKMSWELNSTIPKHTAIGISLLAWFIMFRYMVMSFDTIVLVGIVLILMINPKLRIRFDSSDYCWIIYALIVFCFGLIRDDKAITIKRIIVIFAAILLKILLQTDHKRWSERFINLLIVLGLIHTVSIVVEVINPSFIRTVRDILNVKQVVHRAAYLDGITSQAAIVGFCISIFTCLCVNNYLKSKETRVKYFLLSLLGVSTLLLTGKRALFVEVLFCCFIVTYLYYAVIMKKGFRLFTIVLVVILLIPFVTRLSVFSRNIDRLIYGDDAGRLIIWEVLINNFKSSPLIGVGRNAYYDQMDIGAHNEYLRVLSENGLLGFSFFFIALIIPLVKLTRTVIYNRNAIKQMVFTEDKYIVFELLTSICWQLLILLYALTGNPLNTINQFASYMAFTAMGLCAKKKIKNWL